MSNDTSLPPLVPPPLIPPPPPVIPRRMNRFVYWTLIVIAGLSIAFAGFMAFRLVQLVRYVQQHPRQTAPGEAEFREANRLIITGHGTTSFGNTEEARALAKTYSTSLKILREGFFTKGHRGALTELEGEFVTYCQLNQDSCVFLVHVPGLRGFEGDAKRSLAELAWMNAQSVIQAKSARKPGTVVVGVKGLMLYDTILIGDYVANPKPGQDGIRTRAGGLEEMKLLYPFFVPSTVTTDH
jgi:hypothetical protein